MIAALIILGWILVFLAIAWIHRARPDLLPQADNSHQGRVLPRGTSVVEALRASPQDLEELALLRRGLTPQVAKLREEKPRLPKHDPKQLIHALLDPERFEEQALLGALLVDATLIDLLLKIPHFGLKFSDVRHLNLFLILCSLKCRGTAINLDRACEGLRLQNLLEASGGEEYLRELAGMAASPEDARRYAQRLSERGTPP
jgi:hypothetical protein